MDQTIEEAKEIYSLLAETALRTAKFLGPSPDGATRDHALVFLARGAEILDTVSNLGAFGVLLWMLAKHPEVVEVDLRQMLAIMTDNSRSEKQVITWQ